MIRKPIHMQQTRIFFRTVVSISMVMTFLFAASAHAQSILNPADPLITYDSLNPPVQPAWGQIGKWVRTVRINNWNTSSYKAYIYKGIGFRLKFPKSYNPASADGKKYPMMVFFHGLGEKGVVTDNEYQLYHGGNFFRQAVDNGTFDGFVLAIQSQGFFGDNHYQAIIELIEYMAANNKLDPFHITINGLSAGGQATWEMLMKYPSYVAASVTMSWSSILYRDAAVVNAVKTRPLWLLQGGKDGSPSPSTSEQVRDALLGVGGNIRYTVYPELGHGTWDNTWAEPDFFPFQLRAYASNPWPLFGRTDFCPGDPINVNLALPTGYSEYQWRKGSNLLAEASNVLNVTDTGFYYARVRRGSMWSNWSTAPVHIKIKTATVSPDIAVSGKASKVLPALDGNTSVLLEVPDGYFSYTWQKIGSNATVSNTRFLTAAPGAYRVRVEERFGCSGNFSNVFTVVNANGPDKPDAATHLTASTLSQTSVRLDWSDNPTPAFNETGFEVYMATQSGGPYKFMTLAGQNERKVVLENLNPNTIYYFRIRAVNNTGAAPASAEVRSKTNVDAIAPTAPANLVVVGTTRSSVSLNWKPAADNGASLKYELFVNGERLYVTTDTSFVASELAAARYYNISVRAIDIAGNASPFSNQVTAQTILRGLNYKYYTFTGTWNNLPNFTTLTPLGSGITPNVILDQRTQEDNFAFLWEGFINIPFTGIYYFRTNSDDGSRLWLGALNGTTSPYSFSAVPTVNNDGLHGSVNATSAALNLTAGTYPIAIAFYEQAGGAAMSVSWSTPVTGSNNFVVIPDAAFGEPALAGGTVPAKPSNLVATPASHQRINLSWNDNSNNETAFEIWRSTSAFDGFTTIARIASSATNYADTTVKPNTRYYYRVRALNQYGESDFDKVGQGVDYAYYELTNIVALPDFNAIVPKRTGRLNNFKLGMQERADHFQVKYSSTINIPSNGIYTFFTASDDGSKLYIDGFAEANLIVNNDMTHGVQERSGSKYLLRGAHTIYVTFFESTSSESLAVKISGPGLPKQNIPDNLLGVSFTNATALAPPTAPLLPSGMTANGISKTAIAVNWTDKSDNESAFELYRSTTNNGDYYKYRTLAANTTSFSDTGLFANAIYYYKVSAVNNGGNSAFSNEDSAKASNTLPRINAIDNRTVRVGISTTIQVSAADEDGDALIFSSPNLPSFATLAGNGNRTALLTLDPGMEHFNLSYDQITIIATDTYGGADTTRFALTVNNNSDPIILSIAPVILNEQEQLSIPLTATDADGNAITWSVTNLPNSFTLTPISDQSANLVIRPGYGASGIYTVLVTARDDQGGQSNISFNLNVVDKNPNKKVYIRFMHSEVAGAPWNSVTSHVHSNFRDEDNVTTSIGYNLVPGAWNVRPDGPTTGNNSGVYPDAVLKNYIYFGTWWTPATQNIVLNGLNPSGRYNLTFHSGTAWTEGPNGTTVFTVNGQSVAIKVQDNTSRTGSLNNIQPAADGTITVVMSKTSESYAGFINSIVINSLYDDGTAPAAPSNLVAINKAGQGVQLSWQDNSYNEAEFQVFRSLSINGPYEQAGTATTDVAGMLDENTNGNTQYFYKVRSMNARGVSAFTTPAGIQTLNRIPKLTNIADVLMLNNQVVNINVSAVDDVNDQVRLEASSLPPFISFTDLGNGTGTLSIRPNEGSVGLYAAITITATDESDSSGVASFNLTVRDKDLTNQFYLNFSDGSAFAANPWNNLAGWPFVNTSWNNIKDESNAATTLTVTLPDGFQGSRSAGLRSRNGKELYPEVVTRTGEYEGTTTTRRVVVGGLNNTRRYNFVFFNSQDNGYNCTTNFTIGTQTVTLNATNNLNKTVQINGILPTNGQVTISVSKATGADFAVLSAMIIQEYIPSTTTILGPTNLRVSDAKTSSVTLQWQDRCDSETAYEVLRALPGGTYTTLTGALPANTTYYTDATVIPGEHYYYVVRAKKSSIISDNSNVAHAVAYRNMVYVNFSKDLVAPAPWNNTRTVPQTGFVWPNLKDLAGSPSSINLEQTGHFGGLYDGGVKTGNNSGVFPDAVISESYGLFPGQSATIKLTGLHLEMKYDLTFFASSTIIGDVNVGYTINGKTSLLNASLNRIATLTMYGIEPDENGAVIIRIAPGTPTSEFGLIGALVIKTYGAESAAAPSVAMAISSAQVTAQEEKAPAMEESPLHVFPNPFRESFRVSLPAKENDKVVITLLNTAGNVVYRKQYAGLVHGMNTISIQPGVLAPGIYIMQISYVNRKETKQFKLIRH
jgi:predicted esterase